MSQLNVALIRKVITWIIDVLGLCVDILSMGVLYNQAPADAWSTDAGIRCLYSISTKNLDSRQNSYLFTPAQAKILKIGYFRNNVR